MNICYITFKPLFAHFGLKYIHFISSNIYNHVVNDSVPSLLNNILVLPNLHNLLFPSEPHYYSWTSSRPPKMLSLYGHLWEMVDHKRPDQRESQGPITWGGLRRLAGLARFARISARLWNRLKINFAITWNFSPASWDENLPCNRDCRANTFSSLNFTSEQNGSPEDRYFSYYITHEGSSDYKAM